MIKLDLNKVKFKMLYNNVLHNHSLMSSDSNILNYLSSCNLIIILTLFMSLIPLYQQFQFRSVSISPSSYIINQLSTYTFYIDRTITNNLVLTNWQSQSVSSTSKIKIIFPQQYKVFNNFTCQYIQIQTNTQIFTVSSGYSLNMYDQTVEINNVFSQINNNSVIVKHVTVIINNIINPSPALITNNFIVQIDNDISQNSSQSSINLQPQQFSSIFLTFQPKTVNTTGNLIINFTCINNIPLNSNLLIKFPSTLTWKRQISPNYLLNLNNVTNNCIAVTNNINNENVASCTGSNNNEIVVINGFNKVEVISGSNVVIKIGGLYSPPTLQQIDSLQVYIQTLYNKHNQYYYLIYQSVYITNLSPKVLPLIISPLQSMYVNSKIGLQFNLTLPDTINQNDYFIFTFASSSSFSYTLATSYNIPNFSLNSTFSYDTNTKTLTLKQRNQTQINFAMRNISIGLRTFTAPYSIKSFSIKVQLVRNGYQMAKGEYMMNAVVNSYVNNSNIKMSNNKINQLINYYIVINISDQHSSKMMIDITLPSNLKLSTSTTQSFSIQTNLSLSLYFPQFSSLLSPVTNKTTLTITNSLSTSSSPTISPQLILITLYNILNPPSVQQIPSFQIKTYYNNSVEQQVSLSVINTSNLILMNGVILESNVKIILEDRVNYKYTNMVIEMKIQNMIQSNGYVNINIPKQININNITKITLINNNNTNQLNLLYSINNNNNIKILNNLTQSFISEFIIIFKLYNILTSPSTIPIYGFQISTYTSNNNLIDKLNDNNTIFIQNNKTNQFIMLNNTMKVLSRESDKNQQLTNYTICLYQEQKIEDDNKLIVIMNKSIILPIIIRCIDNIDKVQIQCSHIQTLPQSILQSYSNMNYTQSQYISISLSSYKSQNQINITIVNISNPISFKPFFLSVISTDPSYEYLYSSLINSGPYSNSIQSSISIPSYSFSVRQLNTLTQLNFTYKSINQIYKLIIQPDDEFKINQLIVQCQYSTVQNNNNQSQIKCEINNNNQIIIYSNNNNKSLSKQFNVSIKNIITPDKQYLIPSVFTIYSYDKQNYKIGINNNTIQYTLQCLLPCKTCVSLNKSSCLSCYRNQVSLNTSYNYKQYFFNNTCYFSCPDYYIQNKNQYICELCSQPCLMCQYNKSYCTSCNITTEYKYLLIQSLQSNNVSSISSTCVKTCPNSYYVDNNQIVIKCKMCKEPCYQCTSENICLTCVNNTLYLYQGKCINECPINITVIDTTNNNKCIPCNKQCEKCSILSSNCTSCSNISILHEGKCILQCPSPLIVHNRQCIQCSIQCLTCSILPQNCTSCNKSQSLYKYYFAYSSTQIFSCLQKCPIFYYSNYNQSCIPCSTLKTGCDNCLNQTYCLQCNLGLVYLKGKCLTQTPVGYVNISGIATLCEGDCKSCSNTVDNCTSCKMLNLNGNLCVNNCDYGETPINQLCSLCKYPCQTCKQQIFLCQSCFTNSSLFLYQNQCLESCPSQYYPSITQSKCIKCLQPCKQCINQKQCTKCIDDYNFLQENKTCIQKCPVNVMVPENQVCVLCDTKCKYCEVKKSNCTECEQGYYLYNHTCITECPMKTINNQLLNKCDNCISPCQRCINTTNTCLTCINSTYFLNNTCLSTCPQQYYLSNSLTCTKCISPCLTCSSQSICLSCPLTTPYLFNKTCIISCPSTYGKLTNNTCTVCDSGCYRCQSSGKCLQCYSSFIQLQNYCFATCPDNYEQIYQNGTKTCKLKQTVDIVLQKSLASGNSILPLPFTIFAGVILVAGVISKLQNDNTYFVGFAYSVFGILQSLSLAYLVYNYIFILQTPLQLNIYIFIIGISSILFLNVLSLLTTCVYFSKDKKFNSWTHSSSSSNVITYYIISLISLIINYKFRLIMFSRIFNFSNFRAELESVQKFKILNLFSFLGILSESLIIYVVIKQILVYQNKKDIFLIFIDVLIVLCTNIIISILSSHKKQEFFVEIINGVKINKKISLSMEEDNNINQKININQNNISYQQQYYPYYTTRKTGFDSSEDKLNTNNCLINNNIKGKKDKKQKDMSKIIIDEFQQQITMQIDERKQYQNQQNQFNQADLSSHTLRYKDQLTNDNHHIISKKSKTNRLKKLSIFEQPEQYNQIDQHTQQQQLSFQLSIKSKQSENIFGESLLKKQKQYNIDNNDNYSQFKKQQKVNKQIQQSAEQFNKINKQNQFRQNYQNIINMKKIKENGKNKKKIKKNQLQNNNIKYQQIQQNFKNNDDINQENINQTIDQNKLSVTNTILNRQPQINQQSSNINKFNNTIHYNGQQNKIQQQNINNKQNNNLNNKKYQITNNQPIKEQKHVQIFQAKQQELISQIEYEKQSVNIEDYTNTINRLQFNTQNQLKPQQELQQNQIQINKFKNKINNYYQDNNNNNKNYDPKNIILPINKNNSNHKIPNNSITIQPQKQQKPRQSPYLHINFENLHHQQHPISKRHPNNSINKKYSPTSPQQIQIKSSSKKILQLQQSSEDEQSYNIKNHIKSKLSKTRINQQKNNKNQQKYFTRTASKKNNYTMETQIINNNNSNINNMNNNNNSNGNINTINNSYQLHKKINKLNHNNNNNNNEHQYNDNTTNSIKNQQYRDQLDNFSMQHIKFKPSIQNNKNKNIKKNNGLLLQQQLQQTQQLFQRKNTFLSNQTLPKPYVTTNNLYKSKNQLSPIKKSKSPLHQYHSRLQIYQNNKSKILPNNNKHNQDNYYQSNSLQKKKKRPNSNFKNQKNIDQQATRRFKQLEKIYLQKLH